MKADEVDRTTRVSSRPSQVCTPRGSNASVYMEYYIRNMHLVCSLLCISAALCCSQIVGSSVSFRDGDLDTVYSSAKSTDLVEHPKLAQLALCFLRKYTQLDLTRAFHLRLKKRILAIF